MTGYFSITFAIYSNGDVMKKAYPFLSVLVIFAFGLLLRFSFSLSEHASWSYIVSSVNASAWELFKPFALSFIGMIIISLSALRPSLLRFVCDSISGLVVLCASVLAAGSVCSFYCAPEIFYELTAFAGVALSQGVTFSLYRHRVKTELFAVPLIIFFCALIFMLLFLSFYPPPHFVFFDYFRGHCGRTVTFDALEDYRKLIITTFL